MPYTPDTGSDAQTFKTCQHQQQNFTFVLLVIFLDFLKFLHQ